MTSSELGYLLLKCDTFPPINSCNTLILFIPFRFADECGWCKRIIPFGSSEFSATAEGLKYCSESCFSQSRRASYKRAKTCDWCKHVRHAVSYVDFQDGASQLQFCSDKCLNQYKMQIFCKETQAHLDLNPHLKEKAKSSNDSLITPDLWMRNCRSRSMTPDQRSNDSRTTDSPTLPIISSPLPILKMAAVSKLLSPDAATRDESGEPQNYSQFLQKTRLLRKRRTNRLNSNSNSVMSSGGQSENSNNNNDSSNENRNADMANLMKETSKIGNLLKSSLMTPKISPKAAPIDDPNATFFKRYRMMPQQTSNMYAMNENRSLQHALRQSGQFIAPLIPSEAASADVIQALPRAELPFPKASPVLRSHSDPINSRKHETENRHPFMMQQQPKPHLNHMISNMFGTVAPPSTLLIPYPVILPLPLPIPIPLPYEAFLRAAQRNPNTNAPHCKGTAPTAPFIANSHKVSDEPLDFTKDKITCNALEDSDDDDQRLSHSSRSYRHDTERSDTHDAGKLKSQRPSHKRSFTKEHACEANRPLRKRKRIIDCDYLKFKDTNSNEAARKAI